MKELIDRIEQRALKTAFSGVVSIFDEHSVIFSKAYGYRDLPNKLINNTNTRFGTASGTKLFTAVAIGKLIDQGKLSLHTTIGEIDKAYATFIDENATVLNLLTHTSGIYDYYDEEIIEDFDNFHVEIPWFKLETPSDYLPLFEGKKMKFPANERYSYSNGGFVLLGILIERISGMRYRDFMREQILQPANMYDSGFFALNNLPENTAVGYLSDRKTSNIYNIPIRGGGDGGMYTTTEDLNAFWHRFISGNLLSPELTKEFLKTHHPFNEQNGYGCGIYKRVDNSMYYIIGSDAGVGFESRYLPQKKLVINILSNITDGEEEVSAVMKNL